MEANVHQALVLFAHGARAAAWAAPFERLRELTQARLPGTGVHLAFLELMTPRLPELVQSLLDGLPAGAMLDVTVVPVFLGQGGHVLRDLPLLVEESASAAASLEEQAGSLSQVVSIFKLDDAQVQAQAPVRARPAVVAAARPVVKPASKPAPKKLAPKVPADDAWEEF